MTHPDDPSVPGPDADPSAGAEPLDAALLAAAARYHAPAPPVPADEMWAAIQARRARAAAPGGAAADRAPGDLAPPAPALRVVRLPAGRGRRAPAPLARWASLAAAAVLLVAVGVGIGRRTAPRGGAVAAAPAAAAPDVASPNGAAPNGAAPDAAAPDAVAAGETGARAPSGGAAAPPTPQVAAAGPSAEARPAARAPLDVTRDAAPAAAPAAVASADAPSAPLRAVTEQHLARAEALLTTFAVSEAAGRSRGAPAAAPDSAWARDLLTTTRLLLDSPAARDPARRSLLEALELVLGQIARLPRADTPEERALIDRALRQGDLMARLRGAVPAGAPAGVAPAARGT